MDEFPSYLCLTDLLDQDLSSYEYFQTLAPEVQTALRRQDDGAQPQISESARRLGAAPGRSFVPPPYSATGGAGLQGRKFSLRVGNR